MTTLNEELKEEQQYYDSTSRDHEMSSLSTWSSKKKEGDDWDDLHAKTPPGQMEWTINPSGSGV